MSACLTDQIAASRWMTSRCSRSSTTPRPAPARRTASICSNASPPRCRPAEAPDSAGKGGINVPLTCRAHARAMQRSGYRMPPADRRITANLPSPRTMRRARLSGRCCCGRGVVSADDMVSALSHQGREAGRLPDVLRARGLVLERDLLEVEARNWGIKVLDLATALPDPRLIDMLGATDCLRHGLVPWRRVGGMTVVALSRPEEFRPPSPHAGGPARPHRHRHRAAARYHGGRACMAWSPAGAGCGKPGARCRKLPRLAETAPRAARHGRDRRHPCPGPCSRPWALALAF